MQAEPLLTQAELDFIQSLQDKPDAASDQSRPDLLVDAGGQVKALLAHCAAHEQLTIEAHFANQRLTFTPHLVEDAQHAQHLELGTPLIYDEGPVDRAWRLPLEPAVALCQRDATPSNLWVREVSMSGLLVEQRAKHEPPRRISLMLPLSDHKPVAIQAALVRRTPQGLLAYRMRPLNRRGRERLQHFIYQRHRSHFPQAHSA